MAVIVTDENFEEIVIRSNKPVLLAVWADWSNTCKMMSLVIEGLHADYKDIAVIAKIDAERNHAAGRCADGSGSVPGDAAR